MTRWRPAPTIRFKALGLNWWSGKLLAAEVYDDAGRLKGVRPLGGTVEFGETAEVAVVREFEEELGQRVTISGPARFMENLYVHEGHAGHEIIALFDVTFSDDHIAEPGRFSFREDNGEQCFADWFALDLLDGPNQPALYPSGLKELLLSP